MRPRPCHPLSLPDSRFQSLSRTTSQLRGAIFFERKFRLRASKQQHAADMPGDTRAKKQRGARIGITSYYKTGQIRGF
jgi:hypothetical protein